MTKIRVPNIYVLCQKFPEFTLQNNHTVTNKYTCTHAPNYIQLQVNRIKKPILFSTVPQSLNIKVHYNIYE